MKLIKTDSFEIATIASGDENSSRFALALPGLLDTKDYAHLKSHIDFLASKGFYALSFDPPGTWESPGDISLYTATNYLKAIHELIKYFGNRPTFVMGHSRGATMSIAAGVTSPNVFAFAAVMPSHIRGDYLGLKDEQWHGKGYRQEMRDLPPGNSEQSKEFKLPYSFFEDQIRYNFTVQLSKYTKPKLFIYGKHDEAATPERVHKIFEIASLPKELVGIESDHNYRYHPKLIDQVNDLVGNLLDSIDTVT